MALDKKLIDQLKKDLAEINKIYEQIGETPLTVDFDTAGVDDIKLVRDYLSEARTFVEDLDDGFGGMAASVNAIVREWNSGFASPTKEATKSFGKLKGIAEKLSDDFKGVSELRGKEVRSIEKAARIEVERLKTLKAELENKKKQLKEGEKLSDEEEALLANLKSEYEVQQEILAGAKKRLEKEIEIEKRIGFAGSAFKGISKTLGKIGIESETLSSINNDIRKTAEEGGSSFKVMGTAIKGSAGALKDALLNDALVQLIVIQKVFTSIIKLISHASDSSFQVSQNLATSNENGFKAYKQMKEFASYANESSTTLDRLLKTNSSLNDTLGTSVIFSKQQLETQSKLTNVLGLNEQEAAGILRLSLEQGKSQEEIVDGIRLQGEGLVNANEVLKEISTTNGQLGFNYRKNTEQLAKSVFEAKRLGINIENSKDISSGLLDFEQSIASELEAELLTGKDLNFERARQLALQGKSVEAAIEIRKQVGSAAEFGKMNVIQQEAVAKAAGMTVDQLADSLRKEEQLQALADSKNISLQEAAKLREQEEAASQRLANSADRVKTAFTSLAVKYLTPLMEDFAEFIENIESNEAFKNTVKLIGGIATGVGVVGSIGLALKTLFGGRRGSNPMKPMYVALTGMGKGFGKLTSKIGGKLTKGLSKIVGGKGNPVGRALRKVAAGKIAKGAGKSIAKGAGKSAAKLGAKALGKGLLKKIPGVGLLAGVGFGLQRALKGDFAGAALELASGAASTIPGIGTAASVGLDAALAARDIKQATPMAVGGIVTKPTNALVGEAGAEAVIPLNEFYKKFDELIAAVKQGGDVYMDSTKVGTAMSVGTYKVQ